MSKRKKPSPSRRVYRSPSGRFVSKAEWKHWREQARAAKKSKAVPVKTRFAARKIPGKPTATTSGTKSGLVYSKFRTNLGGKVPTRPNTPEGERLRRQKAALLKARQLPKPDAQEKFLATDGTKFQIAYYRYEGLDAEPEVRAHLYLLPDDGSVQTRVSIGTGYGRNSEWMGSAANSPRNTLRWMDDWKRRPSGRAILDKAGTEVSTIWFELEVRTNNWKQGATYAGKRKRRSAKRSKAGRGKAVRAAGVRSVQRRGTKKVQRKGMWKRKR